MTDYAQSPQFDIKSGRFQHPSGKKNDKSFSDFVEMAKSYFNKPDDPDVSRGFPVVEPSILKTGLFAEEVMWIGHSTVMINHSGQTVLCDPQFSDRASPFSFAGPKRLTALPLEIAQLPKIDIVLISHGHYDHLDKPSIVELCTRQPHIHFLVPLGLASLLRGWGAAHVSEHDWWEPVNWAGMRIQPTAVQHWTSRKVIDRNKSLWCGWMVDWPDFRFYFTGDSGYCDDFRITRERLGAPDLAAIPIGAYNPRHFMAFSHVNPDESVRMFQDLQAKRAFAIHWGTFKLTLEPVAEPPQRLSQALKTAGIDEKLFRVLKHGESMSLMSD